MLLSKKIYNWRVFTTFQHTKLCSFYVLCLCFMYVSGSSFADTSRGKKTSSRQAPNSRLQIKYLFPRGR